MLFACSCQHMLNTFPFIQRTEQVLIELDISAIEEYVIIIIIIKYNVVCGVSSSKKGGLVGGEMLIHHDYIKYKLKINKITYFV